MNDRSILQFGGVYSIKNKVNGKRYIGSTAKFSNRINQHNTLLRKGHTNKALQNAVNKYGIENFVFEVIEFTSNPNKESLMVLEGFWIDYFSKRTKLYNILSTPYTNLGYKHSTHVKEEYWNNNKDKASTYAKERWNNPEIREKMEKGHRKYKVIKFLSPSNEIIEVHDLKEFTIQYGLYYRSVHKLCSGNLKSHRGWKIAQ